MNQQKRNPHQPYDQKRQKGEDNQWSIALGQKLGNLPQLNASELIAIAEAAGAHLGQGKKDNHGQFIINGIDLKINQIRRFLDAVRRIEGEIKKLDKAPDSFNNIKDSVVLLRPKLAYAAGRDKGKKVMHLMNILDPAIIAVTQSTDDKFKINFEKLLRLIEGIVAYHKFFGGND